MTQTIIIIAVVLAMLALERTLVLTITRNLRCQTFIRHHFWLHPNGISCLRIPQGFIAIWMASTGRWGLGILWFAFWMITDLTDGTIARNCDLATKTGEWLDPLADKFMSFPPLFYLAMGSSPNVVSPHLPIGWVVLYCALDLVGQCSRLFCKKKAANSFGKAKTALVTILISIMAFYQFCLSQNHPLFPPLTSLNALVVTRLMQACTILAFLSLYCQVIPSNWYANSLTFLNFLCGICAIAVAWMPNSIRNSHILAFTLIFMGQFFDLFDGRMARKYGSTNHGAIYDDIADGTNFGLANASIVLVGLGRNLAPIPLVLAIALAILYLACVIFRLYRFLKPTIDLPRGIFQGLPSPGGALLAGAAAIAAAQLNSTIASWTAAAIVLLASGMMVSNIPYRHFGQDLWPSLPKGFRVMLLILCIVFICFALVKRDWAEAFTWFTNGLAFLYAFGAIAPKNYLERLRQEQAADDEEMPTADTTNVASLSEPTPENHK